MLQQRKPLGQKSLSLLILTNKPEEAIILNESAEENLPQNPEIITKWMFWGVIMLENDISVQLCMQKLNFSSYFVYIIDHECCIITWPHWINPNNKMSSHIVLQYSPAID